VKGKGRSDKDDNDVEDDGNFSTDFEACAHGAPQIWLNGDMDHDHLWAMNQDCLCTSAQL